MDYKSTLNMLKTDFPMRAGLPQREPSFLEKWYEEDIYSKMMERNEGKPLFVLHDGPPYANGGIHLGTAMNKCLKDFIVKYKNMTGFKSPYVPGWDTHGLPTELKARKKAGITSTSTISDVELRKICREYAEQYLNEQRNQFKRLGVLGEWDNPYVTLTHDFEEEQIKVFSEMAEKGYIYKGLKPVYWCPDCNTALAEAEIEYADDDCYSIYVKFAVKDDKGILKSAGADISKTYFVIWTTTTWTLPGNLAICLGPRFDYALIKCEDEYFVMAKELCDGAMAEYGKEYEIIAEFKGADLEYITCQHPFLDRESLVINGEHVTLESGTGCVHTAPGFGVEDFDVCNNYDEIGITVPVDSKGKLTAEAGQFEGLTTDEANKQIAIFLEEHGNLFAMKKIVHQYPHCWRCKQPILFRATSQWFCSVENFKEEACTAADGVKWYPAWGLDRLKNMIRERKDWCISRQRKWGVPIPVFYCDSCGKEIIDKDLMDNVASVFGKEGSDAWYAHESDYFIPDGYKCPHCGESKGFSKEKDIMDVWFDSGSSHRAVCKNRPYLHWPADVYLEGADQFRGWFQSSMLTSVATTGKAPYKEVITHGWVVDGKGRQMHKSLGNGIAPEEVINKYGADILRLWVASSDYHADVRISPDILKQLSEIYRKIRNTSRFILGNISDFDPDKDSVAESELEEIDKWALCALDKLIDYTKENYEKYEYHTIFHALHNFCVIDMSNFYLDVLKDRLYVERADSKTRRAAQTTMYKILDALTLLITPILAFTADEIWASMPHDASRDARSPLLNDMPEAKGLYKDLAAKWDRIHAVRDDVNKALEEARNNKLIGKPLESKIKLFAQGELLEFLNENKSVLPASFIVSQVEVSEGEGEFKGDVEGLSVTVCKADGQKCQRCWSYSETVGTVEGNDEICARCAAILGE